MDMNRMDKDRMDGDMKFLVTFGTSKKIIKVASCEEITAAISESFELRHAFDIKYFDKDFDEWVDVTEMNTIPTMSKLLVTKKAQEPETSGFLDLLNFDGIPKQFDAFDEPRASVGCLGDAQMSICEPLSGDIIGSSNTTGVSSDRVSTSSDENTQNWISSYQLPHFSKYAAGQLEVLDATEHLNSKVRRDIVAKLYQSMVCHTMYPTRHEYSTVGNLLIFKYPSLKDRYASKGCHHNSWLVSLKNKFKEHRRTLINDPKHQEMKEKYGGRTKRPFSSACNETLSTCRKKLRTSVISINSELGTYEDKFSVDLHIKTIKEEMKKKQPNMDVLKDRFRRSYTSRRKDIHSGKTTGQILEDYPCLQIPEFIIEEMRIITRVDLTAAFKNLDSEKMRKMKALALGKWAKITPHTKKLIEHDESCWILVLHDLSKTKGFVYEKSPATPHPSLIFDDTRLLTVMFDNQIIKDIESFSCAVCCALGLYWVFNIDFPSSQKKFLTILSKYIFDLPGLDYMPSALRLMNSL